METIGPLETVCSDGAKVKIFSDVCHLFFDIFHFRLVLIGP